MAKSFAWSYSKGKNFETCPKRHYEVDLVKNFTDSSEQLKWGNEVHAALANACRGTALLPPEMKYAQPYVDVVKAAPGELFVEQDYAITRDFQPTAWFAPNAWFRAKVDLIKINRAKRSGTALDWKTGKVTHDSRQLMLSAQCIFAHHPEIDEIKTRFVWLKEMCTTPEVFHRDTIAREWVGPLELAKQMEEAAKTLTYPPKPGRLCFKHCPVLSCPFHGKSYRG